MNLRMDSLDNSFNLSTLQSVVSLNIRISDSKKRADRNIVRSIRKPPHERPLVQSNIFGTNDYVRVPEGLNTAPDDCQIREINSHSNDHISSCREYAVNYAH